MKKFFVLVVGAVFLVCLAGPVMAAEAPEKSVNVSGRMNFPMFWQNRSKEVTGFIDDDKDLNWLNYQPLTTLNFNVAMGDVSGSVAFNSAGGGSNGVAWWFASWNFGLGTLNAGYKWAPDWQLVGNRAVNQVIPGMFMPNTCWQGDAFLDYDDLVEVSIKGLTVALVDPSGSGTPWNFPSPSDTDITVPKIAASYMFSVGPLTLVPFGAYSTFDVVDTTTNKTYDVTGYDYGIKVSFATGPFGASGVWWDSQNPVEMNLGLEAVFGPSLTAVYESTPDGIVDADMTGWCVAGSYTISDMLKIQAGYATVSSERQQTGILGENTDVSAYWVNLPITLAPGVVLTPEWAKDDWGSSMVSSSPGATPTYSNNGDTTYYGATLDIFF